MIDNSRPNARNIILVASIKLYALKLVKEFFISITLIMVFIHQHSLGGSS